MRIGKLLYGSARRLEQLFDDDGVISAYSDSDCAGCLSPRAEGSGLRRRHDEGGQKGEDA